MNPLIERTFAQVESHLGSDVSLVVLGVAGSLSNGGEEAKVWETFLRLK